MDHQTFHSMEIDALYEELDAPTAAGIREHAASCPECAARFERLRVARQRGLSVLVEAVPDNFESRIMAAVDAALAKRAGAQVIPMHAGHPYASAPPPQASPPGTQSAGAKVIPFFARPSFAVAATLILVIGAAALVTQTSMSRKSASAPMAMDESSPAASAMAASPAPNAPVVAAATAAAEPPIGAVALNERGAAAPNDPSPPPPPMAVARSEAPAAKPAKSRPAGPSGGAPGPQSAFDAAVSLFDAGRFPEALPRFEALKASNPEAELYAARCLLRTKGCGAATAARFDTAAQRNSGTETGSRARIEGAKCYQQMGQAQAARTRYQAAENEGFLASEARQDREALDQQPAATSPGTPAAGTKASPKAPAPTLK